MGHGTAMSGAWHIWCVRVHGTVQGRYPVMGVLCSPWQTQQVWRVQQRSMQGERAQRVFVTHLNGNAVGISERQEQGI